MKWLARFSFALFFTLCFLKLSAQETSCGGQVTGQGSPLAYPTIIVVEDSLRLQGDVNGYFQIHLGANEEVSLVISYLGFFSQEVVIRLDDECSDIKINLQPKEGSLEDIVVSGNLRPVSRMNSPVPVEVYSSSYFKSNPTPSLYESLQNVNGVRPQLNCNVCNTGDIHINGLEGPYTMVLIDGMPIVSGLSTVYGLTGIPQSLVERIEVVKGPASTLYGSEAVGGLINIITKNPLQANRFTADVFATSWAEVNMDLGGRFAIGDRVDALLGVNYFNYQLPLDKNDDGFTDVSLQQRVSVFQKFRFKRNKGREFSIAGRYVYEDRWGGEMDWNKTFRGGDEVYGESIYTSRWEALGVYQFPCREEVKLRFSANGHHQNSVYGNTVYLADQSVAFGQLTWRKRLAGNELLTGITYRMTHFDDNTVATQGVAGNQPSAIHLPGLFVQNELDIHPQHSFLLGLRYDYNSVHGSILSPRINYKWLSENRKHVIRLSAGNGYRVANVFTEDHAALTGARTVEFASELRPETSWNANINLVERIYSSKGYFLSFDFTGFFTHFTNQILPDYDTDPNKIIYDNLEGYALSKGMSCNIDLTTESGFSARIGGTLMDVSTYENGLRTRQILTEQFQGIWRLSYEWSRADFSLDYTGTLYGPMRLPLLGDLDDRPEYSPWWSLQNIQLTKGFGKRWEIYGGVKNLLNYRPPANSIARSFDPFDRQVQFDANGQAIATNDNPNALTFDPSYVFAPNQGIRGFLGVRVAFD
ncbi:MAG: TonB-dependent receptor [Chitinophagales bacterium]